MRFRYLKDPLFGVACFLYCANRWLLKPRTDSAILRFWFNDLLLVACAIPVVLSAFALLKLREEDERLSSVELSWIVATWSLLFEWIGPNFLSVGTADPIDVLMYLAGGVICWWWWNYREKAGPAREL